MRRVVELLGHWLWARLALVVLAALVILPDLGGPGLWEPQELAVADRAVARSEKAAGKKPGRTAPQRTPVRQEVPSQATAPGASGAAAPSAAPAPAPAVDEDEAEDADEELLGPCPKTAPNDAGARTLTEQLAARDTTDRGMRWPLALLGLLTVLGVAGIGFRLGGTRAGIIAGLVCLSFPLLALQSRQLTSEIGGAAGATLIVYGLLFAVRPARGVWLLTDAIAAALALAAGTWIAFLASGAFLGVLVPVGAVAIAGRLGWPALRAAGAIAGHRLGRAVTALRPRHRNLPRVARTGGMPAADWLASGVALAATAAAIVVIVILAIQLYDIRDPIPGTRAVFGKSIVPSDCWSTALGGRWKFDDDLRATYDVAFEQIAFGTFPWGLAAPIAIAMLLGSRAREHRFAGALAFVWAGGAWIATLAFQRKVGFSIYAGFPAMAVAVGLYVDHLLARLGDPNEDTEGPRIGLLAGLFVFLGAFTLGKDLQTFPERLTSLLVGSDAIKYPKNAMLLGFPVRAWAMGLGVVVALTFALSLWLWRGGDGHRARALRRYARISLFGSLAATVVLALFWTHGWHRVLSKNLSSKNVFATYQALRQDGDKLAILGEMGNAPRYYAGGPYEKLGSREQLMTLLQAPQPRVFALVPGPELCAIHRAAAGKRYFVLDDSNARTLLLSNSDRGASDVNPLTRAILRSEPKGIKTRPPGRVVFDNQIELIGWTLPARTGRGDDFTVTLYFKVLRQVGGSWQIFAHFEPAGAPRFQGDHWPINDRCKTSFWQEGDYIVDTFKVEAGDVSSVKAPYVTWIGFFTGSSGNWRNMPVVAPEGMRDSADRVKIGTIVVQ